jgi:hypothetical protein
VWPTTWAASVALPAAGPSHSRQTLAVSVHFAHRPLSPLISCSALSLATHLSQSPPLLPRLLRRRPTPFRHRGDGPSKARKPELEPHSAPSGVRAPTPSSYFEVSSPAAIEEQTDPFLCCFVNPCTRCSFYKSRWWGTTRAERAVSRGFGGSAPSSGSPSKRSTASRGGSGNTGDSDQPSTNSSSDESASITPVRFHSATPLGFHWVLRTKLDLCTTLV